MHIACENEHSVGTISTILAVSVAHTASGWTAVARLGKVSLFGPKGVVTERGLDGFLPSVMGGVSKMSH